MLKMFKYEMIHSYRTYFMVFAIYLIACIVVPILPGTFKLVGASLYSFAIIGICIALLVSVFINFNNSMFKEPGYLTQTLPLTTNQILWSKIFATLVWIFIAGFVLLVGLIIMIGIFTLTLQPVSFGDIFNVFGQAIKALIEDFGNDPIGYLGSIITSIIITTSAIITIYTLITVLQTKFTRKRKALIGCVIAAVYFIINGIYLQPFLKDLFNVYEYVNGETIFMLVSAIIQGTLFYLLMVYILERKLEM